MTNEWQPIETAPKDGTNVIVSDGKQVLTARSYPTTKWLVEGHIWGKIDPTHWQPLPSPPSQ